MYLKWEKNIVWITFVHHLGISVSFYTSKIEKAEDTGRMFDI